MRFDEPFVAPKNPIPRWILGQFYRLQHRGMDRYQNRSKAHPPPPPLPPPRSGNIGIKGKTVEKPGEVKKGWIKPGTLKQTRIRLFHVCIAVPVVFLTTTNDNCPLGTPPPPRVETGSGDAPVWGALRNGSKHEIPHLQPPPPPQGRNRVQGRARLGALRNGSKHEILHLLVQASDFLSQVRSCNTDNISVC